AAADRRARAGCGAPARGGAVALRAGRCRRRAAGHDGRRVWPRDREHRGAGGAQAVSEAPAATAVPTGNTYDKYGSTNPVVKRLMSNFHRALAELWEIAAPESVLDVGCGEGILTCQWAERLPSGRVVGIDLEDPKLQADWRARRRPHPQYRAA